jgi:hypothetical protein
MSCRGCVRIAADQFESQARTLGRHAREGLHERRHVPPVEDRPDEQHQRDPAQAMGRESTP